MYNDVELNKWCLDRAMELEGTTEGVLIAAGQIRNFVLPTPLVEEIDRSRSNHVNDAIVYHQGIQVDSNSPKPIERPAKTEARKVADILDGQFDHIEKPAVAPEPEECINEAAKVVEKAKKDKPEPIFPSGKTLKVHNAIVKTYLENKEPRAKQISDMVGFKSTASAHHHIKLLEQRGFIKKDKRGFVDVVLIPIKTADGTRIPARAMVDQKKTEDRLGEKLEFNELGVLNRIIAAEISDAPINADMIAHNWKCSPASARKQFTALINKGYIKLKDNVDSGCEWEVLLDAKGQPYTKPEPQIINGVKVTRLPTATARGFLPFSSKIRGEE